MTLAQILALASAVEPVVGMAAGAISDVELLVTSLKKVTEDLTQVPVDASTGQPVTLEAAAAHLAQSEAESKTQDDTIRDNAAKFRG